MSIMSRCLGRSWATGRIRGPVCTWSCARDDLYWPAGHMQPAHLPKELETSEPVPLPSTERPQPAVRQRPLMADLRLWQCGQRAVTRPRHQAVGVRFRALGRSAQFGHQESLARGGFPASRRADERNCRCLLRGRIGPEAGLATARSATRSGASGGFVSRMRTSSAMSRAIGRVGSSLRKGTHPHTPSQAPCIFVPRQECCTSLAGTSGRDTSSSSLAPRLGLEERIRRASVSRRRTPTGPRRHPDQ